MSKESRMNPAHNKFAKEISILLRVAHKKERHKYYKHNVKYAELLIQLNSKETSGEYGKLLHKYIEEDDEYHEARKKITIPFIYSIINRIMAPTSKVERSGDMKTTLSHENDNSEIKIKSKGESFHAGKDVLGYAFEMTYLLNRLDPNAWIRIGWDRFDNKIETATAAPSVIWSSRALNWEIKNGNPEWLVTTTGEMNVAIPDKKLKTVAADIESLIKDSVSSKEEIFTYFGRNANITAKIVERQNENTIEIATGVYYEIQITEHKRDFILFKRAGYIRDTETYNETFVSYYDAAIGDLKELVQTGSEFNISKKRLAFPKSYEAFPECPVTECDKGIITGTENSCKVCSGTGFIMSKNTGLSVTQYALAEDPSLQIDPSKLAYTQPIPIDGIKFQYELIQNGIKAAIESVYNPDALIQTTFAKTATESELNSQNPKDVLYQYAKAVSDMYVFLYKSIAAAMQLDKGFTVEMIAKSDFNFRTLGQSIAELTQLSTVGAMSLVEQTVSDIIDLEFQGSRQKLERAKVLNKFQPFIGKTPDQVNLLINSQNVLRSTKVLYIYFHQIFLELETENKDFYQIGYANQVKLVNEKVSDIIRELGNETIPIV